MNVFFELFSTIIERRERLALERSNLLHDEIVHMLCLQTGQHWWWWHVELQTRRFSSLRVLKKRLSDCWILEMAPSDGIPPALHS